MVQQELVGIPRVDKRIERLAALMKEYRHALRMAAYWQGQVETIRDKGHNLAISFMEVRDDNTAGN